MCSFKTLKKRAANREQYLYTWRATSNQNVVDAVTGATLSSHETHRVTWDCRDTAGAVVPDGDYRIRVEFTSGDKGFDVAALRSSDGEPRGGGGRG